ncbi:MAG: hypothetical protein E7425_00420 [Ruminococcaceae bacterium]|jgi:hypothetical protein|nr:hypothetical protein [Oscillospiraceae bacterium]
MTEKNITLRLHHPETDAVLTVTLPDSTRFEALVAILYEHGFVCFQKPGYAFLVGGHLCSARHCLRDYLPDGADELDVQIFGIPQIMI